MKFARPICPYTGQECHTPEKCGLLCSPFHTECGKSYGLLLLSAVTALAIAAIALLTSAAMAQSDIPSDPGLRGVLVLVAYSSSLSIANMDTTPAEVKKSGGRWVTLAYSYLDRASRICFVLLPSDRPELVDRLYKHELRHCQGEDHPGRSRFADEEPFQ